MSIAAYRRRNEAAETPRQLELRAFQTVLGRLLEARSQGGRAVVEACHLNAELWTTLLTDLALPANALPDDLKARLISIGIWVQRYTREAIGGKAPLEPLIAVDKAIAEGLAATPPAATPAEAAPTRLAPV